jgi:mRNA-degrading endonuclease toxin of MazEF toxin-antitoxin module
VVRGDVHRINTPNKRGHVALGERVGHLTHDELRSIEDALLLVLDLP